MDTTVLERLKSTSIFIGYTPLSDEIEYANGLLYFEIPQPSIYVPPTLYTDPVLLATEYKRLVGNTTACVITPGRIFDVFGNRKGRGGGWYDKFFANLPESWLRIGVCDSSKLSQQKLKNEVWDVPMHGLMVFDTKTSEWNFLNVSSIR